MRQLFRKLGVLLALSVAGFLLFNGSLVVYGIRQLYGQLNIIYKAVPVSEYLKDPESDTTYFYKLKYLGQVRAFAMDSLKLHASDNYTSFYDQRGKPAMWVVTGCLPYHLEAKEWSFPFLGDVSYKGFFNETLAREEAMKIRRNGFEADIYNPSAWSTLGILNDPILSGMLKRGPGQLAETIIHELTHATVFISGDVDYNENLATFIGEQGAIRFLSNHFGPQSPEKIRYEHLLQDEDVYSQHLLNGSKRLDSLYATFSDEMPVEEKAEKKFSLIADILIGINFLPIQEMQYFRYDFRKNPLPGNTFFMAYRRYRKDQKSFHDLLQGKYQGDLVLMIRDLADK
jgi:predicted aminopeptidase